MLFPEGVALKAEEAHRALQDTQFIKKTPFASGLSRGAKGACILAFKR